MANLAAELFSDQQLLNIKQINTLPSGMISDISPNVVSA
jgi:hypothetical protein